MHYNPREIEKKWKDYWTEHKIYQTNNDSDRPKYYVLDMFPYPSGSGLHVGHPLGYIASDIFARYKRLRGFNVLHPMGYDAFGLPAEQYAIETGVHPADSTAANIARYRQQLDNLGFSFDWERQVTTSDPKFYRWTQWIFLQLFDHYYDRESDRAEPIADLLRRFETEGNGGVRAATNEESTFSAEEWKGYSAAKRDEILMNYRLAYRKVAYVNWCEALGTVLANDEVKDGVSERGGYPVERRPMLQWSLRITAYAERLLRDLDTVEWSEALKTQQRNWIGRSEGAQVFFAIDGSDQQIEIFTTRPDTIFGATFMVLAPEHPLVDQLTSAEQAADVAAYRSYASSRSERERMAEVKEVTGCFIGAYAINPFTEQRVPIWIGDYVLMDYGTGAIMAVPSDDDRDFAFATKFELPVIDVIDKSDYPGSTKSDKVGKMINSQFLNGMEVPAAIRLTIDKIEEKGIGTGRINYRLRDANYSRQRYWGEPFPISYDAEGVAHARPLEELPLELPELDDFKPTADGKSPLAKVDDWVQLPDGQVRETDTMPGFAGSSWYFLRYMDAHNDQAFASPEAINYWRDVDLYVGGTEHAVGHLMYSRFWHKFLYDKGWVPTAEPFRKLINQGMIQGVIEFAYLIKSKEGEKRFICANLARQRGIENVARIPVHVDFVQGYGTDSSYLNIDSIKKFIDWRPEYEDAYFECGRGVYHQGNFEAAGAATDNMLMTHSEVGKMSKRYFNVVNPDDVVERYGADCFRMYEMFLGPIEQSKPWNTNGIDGVSKFLRKFWSLFYDQDGKFLVDDAPASKAELKILHTAIKKMIDDTERFSFNTCVSGFMVATNDLKKLKCHKREVLEGLVVLMAPFAPHLSEELWFRLGKQEPGQSVHRASYPELNLKYLEEDAYEYPISINGKTRTKAQFPASADIEELKQLALANETVAKWTDGKTVRKVIVVPKRMINIVVS
ncbi:MAG: class I tRNA ligase family protein [Bacteroidota bacterium]